MSFLHGFNEPEDMLYKLVRDGRKCHFSKEPMELSDHLFNFCVTGHSLRDWSIKKMGLSGQPKQDYHDECNKNEYLEYCRDIANSTKHYGLSNGDSTVSNIDAKLVDYVSIDIHGNIVPGSESKQNSLNITISDGEEIQLLMFLHGVLNGVKAIFDIYNIPYDKNKSSVSLLASL